VPGLSIQILITVLFVLMPASAQTPNSAQPEKPLSGVPTIDAYSKELDSFAKRNRNRALAFSKIIPEDQPGETLSGNWREFKTAKARESDYNSNHLYDVGDVWLRAGKVVVAEFEYGTSGDWSQYVTYYFRADGSLAKMRNVFGKFMGTIKIVKEKFYDSNGKLLHTRLKCYDLEIEGRRKKCTSDASQYDSELYKRVQNLPVYQLLKSRLARQ